MMPVRKIQLKNKLILVLKGEYFDRVFPPFEEIEDGATLNKIKRYEHYLHCETGHAVKYNSSTDNFGHYYWLNGRCIPDDKYKKTLHDAQWPDRISNILEGNENE